MHLLKSLTINEKKILAVAYLKAQGLSGRAIAEILSNNGYKIDEPRVAVLASEATRKGWMVTQTAEWLFSPGVLHEIRTMASPHAELETHLRSLCPRDTLKELRIFYSGAEGTSAENWNTRLEYFSLPASRRVSELLRRCLNIGVGWGHTLAALVTALEKSCNGPGGPREPQKTLFIPTSGEPLGPDSRPDRASSALASRLAAWWGSEAQPLSLAGVAAVIPRVFNPSERQVIKKYVAEIGDFKRIFGPPAKSIPLVERLDAIVTSVGSFEGQWQMYQSQLIKTGGIPVENLRELAAGDIGGSLIPRQNLDLSRSKQLRLIADSWTGIRLEHYQRMARIATRTRKPGVIVVAIGENKAAVVHEVLRLGLVNVLIIDHTLAEALKRISTARVESLSAASQ